MRNIIICCDGTDNEISENISNGLSSMVPAQKGEDVPRAQQFAQRLAEPRRHITPTAGSASRSAVICRE